jgi:hypothetical protein
MKLSLDPTLMPVHDASPESLALSAWYDSQPLVRRLWGIRAAQQLRVIVMVEATLDNDDVLPGWLSHCAAWREELCRSTRRPVRLQLLDEFVMAGLELDSSDVIIADIYWRDATLSHPYEVF